MKLAATLALIVCGLMAALPVRAESTGLSAPVEECIRGNAVKVSAAIADLNQAVDFLVGKLCAVPIADQAKALQQDAMRETSDSQRKQCDAWKKGHPDAKPTGNDQDYANPCTIADAMASIPANFGYSVIYASGRDAPPDATALAAKLLLDLRLAHTGR